MFLLSDYPLQHIVPFLNPSSILALQSTSLYFSNNSTIEYIWKCYCVRRFLFTNKSPKTTPDTFRVKRHGNLSWKSTYLTWHDAIKLPHGAFTKPDSIVFGRSRCSNVCSWILLKHRSDCILPTVVVNDVQQYSVTLRICIQNLKNNDIEFALSNAFIVNMKSANGEEPIKLFPFNATVIALNGEMITQFDTTPHTSTLSLKYMEYGVIAVTIVTLSSDCVYESDFLCSAKNVLMNYCERINGDYPESKVFNVDFIDESLVWNCYDVLPNGQQILREFDRFL